MRCKHFFIYIISGFLLLVLLFAIAGTERKMPLPSFYITNAEGGGDREIAIYDDGDSNYYVFVPSYASLCQVSVQIADNQDCLIDGVALENGMNCKEWELEVPYSFEVGGRMGTLWFYQSANVATMYIDTLSGGMDYIYGDQNHEESTAVTLYSAEGMIDYYGANDLIKGRGNTSWGISGKRPFALTLSSRANLLGMGENEDWILLNNPQDETNLRNYLALMLGKQLGIEWVPECRWADVYLNGEYNGLYLLVEKVEVDAERLSLNLTAGEFLCKNDLESRWERLRNPFKTAAGRTVEISYPKVIGEKESEEITSKINQMEKAILTGTAFNESQIIDLDSWVIKYLVDEITANIDADSASSFFYFKNGKFYAGPLWDYDLTFGEYIENCESQAFVANCGREYYSELYKNEAFYVRLVEIYESELRPLLQRIIDGELFELADGIKKASAMNSLRWAELREEFGNKGQEEVPLAAGLKAYIEQRVAFLDSAWLENVEYCTVSFQDGGLWYISVRKGEMLPEEYKGFAAKTWIDRQTGEVVDASQPIMTDMALSQPTTDKAQETVRTFGVADYVRILAVVTLLTVMIVFAAIDAGRRYMERRCAE